MAKRKSSVFQDNIEENQLSGNLEAGYEDYVSGDDNDDWNDVPEINEEQDDEESKEDLEETIEIKIGQNQATKKRKGITKKERELRMTLHKSSLLCLFIHGMIRNSWCTKNTLQNFCKTIVPATILGNFSTRGSKLVAKISSLEKLLSWWKSYFTLEDEPECGKINLIDDKEIIFLPYLEQRKGTPSISAQLLVSICRSIGLPTRLVYSLQPTPLKFVKEQPEGISFKRNRSGEITLKANQSGEKINLKNIAPLYWCEVYSYDEARWISMEVISGFVDKLSCFSNNTINPISYVVAYQSDGTVKDVTKRYSTQWGGKTVKYRMDKNNIFFWNSLLEKYSPSRGNLYDENQDQWENAELEARERMETLPKTYDAYRNHPLYFLERHLKKYECLFSKDVVLGHFKGEPVFPRDQVKLLKSSSGWLRRARVIKDNENPYKFVEVKSKDKKNEKIDQNSDDKKVGLYGVWQTVPYSPPQASNGFVPKNPHGTVDLFQPSMLPLGTVHLTLPNIKELAKKFEIDYAEAVVNLEFFRGKIVPILKGIVVCAEYEAILTEASLENEVVKEGQLRKKRERETLARWRKLTKGVLIREKLKEKYGFEDDQEEKSKETSSSSLSSTLSLFSYSSKKGNGTSS